jgi:hypothetical protein
MTAIIVITQGWAMVLAFAGMVLLLIGAHFLIVAGQSKASDEHRDDNVAKRRRGVKALVMGADGRASTSKVQAVLWTFAVFYAFVFLLVWGRSWGCDQEGLRPGDIASCNGAADDRTNFAEVAERDLQADYYVLLGFPLGVAVAARALTTAKVSSGTIAKRPNEKSEGVTQGLREVISNDQGETDLLDFQYFAFNLVTLAFFWTEFLTNPAQGLPDLPATLIGLSGLSAAAYTTRKALETDAKPGISSVIPHRIALAEGSDIAVIGAGFGERATKEAMDDQASSPSWVSPPAWVKVDGIALEIRRWKATRIDALITKELVDLHSGREERSPAAELVVDVQDSLPSEPFSVELIPRPPSRNRPKDES